MYDETAIPNGHHVEGSVMYANQQDDEEEGGYIDDSMFQHLNSELKWLHVNLGNSLHAAIGNDKKLTNIHTTISQMKMMLLAIFPVLFILLWEAFKKKM